MLARVRLLAVGAEPVGVTAIGANATGILAIGQLGDGRDRRRPAGSRRHRPGPAGPRVSGGGPAVCGGAWAAGMLGVGGTSGPGAGGLLGRLYLWRGGDGPRLVGARPTALRVAVVAVIAALWCGAGRHRRAGRTVAAARPTAAAHDDDHPRPTVSSQAMGVNGELLAAADARIQGLPELDTAESLVVVHRGEVVFERYYRGRSATDLADTHSMTKSVTSAVVGVLVSDGALDLDSSVPSLLPPGVTGEQAEPAKEGITVRHLLTMTSGLNADGRDELCEVALHGGSWMAAIFGAPLRSEPGARHTYNNGAVHLLSAVVQEVAGASLSEVAERRLFGPLGITDYCWPTDPQGYPIPSGHLLIAPRDLARLGVLFLRNGAWHDQQLIDAAYVRAATARQVPGAGHFPEGVGYGFLWWIDELAWPPAYFAGGHGGQYLYVVPALDLVAVTTADAYAEPRRFGRALRHLIETYVVGAARS